MGHTVPWTPMREEQLSALEGLPTSEIASRMGITKNAVVGKLNRLRKGYGSREFERRIDELAALHASRPPPVQIPPWGRCQWPEGDVGMHDLRFCGARVSSGGPYCPEHERRARGNYSH